MQQISVRAWLLVFLSAMLQVISFPIAGPVPMWRTCFAWISLVPFLCALLLPSRKKTLGVSASFVLGYFAGFCWYLGNCAWIHQTMYLYGGLAKPISFAILLLFSLYLGLYHALFAALLALFRRSRVGVGGALAAAPFLWVAIELARARITGFPWDLLGNAQVDNLLLTRVAPWAGVMGMSFVLVFIHAAVAGMFVTSDRRRFVPGIAALGLAAMLQVGGTFPSLHESGLQDREKGLPETAVLLQENLEVGVVGREVAPISSSEEVRMFSAESLHPKMLVPSRLAEREGRNETRNPVLIVWPEAPSHLQSSDPAFRQAMTDLARRANAPLVIGSLGVDFSPVSARGYDLYDSAALFAMDGTYQGRYDKVHLVPWGEYIPFKDFFFFARKLTEGVGDMDRGKTRIVFTTGGHRYGVFICYESIFGDEVRAFVRNGAEVLVNISDDGWYGDSGAPWQHLNMARMRAIENHRWVLRSTNTGVTSAIDPQGRITAEAPRHLRGAFLLPFAFEQQTTFYTRHGDWFAYLCALVTMGCVGFSLKFGMN